MTKVDYLIVGQGLAGTLLSRELVRAGRTVAVADCSDNRAASLVCGGIINPVTGKRLVNSWMIEELLPAALSCYREWERESGLKLIRQLDILDFHTDLDSRAVFEDRKTAGNPYLADENETEWRQFFRFNYGIGRIAPCLVLDTGEMVRYWRKRLTQDALLLDERFEINLLETSASSIVYKSIAAAEVIFCEGAAGAENPYFRSLPWSKDKGEALVVEIPGLPQAHVYKHGLSIVPRGDGLFWVGASHDWKYDDLSPSAAFRKKTEDMLNYWLKIPYRVLEHQAARRPANLERKPFLGRHPANPSILIFNGLGGKGCSLGPYFARCLASHLVHGESLPPEADIRRFRNVLLRASA